MANKFDPLSLISPGLSAIGSIAGGLFGKKGSDNAAKTQLRIAQETNANNYRIAQENNAFNERMVDKMNDWNSAKNQRARLEEAGLNPYLMLDGGSAGTANSAPTADTSSVQSIPDVGSTIASGAQQLGSSISSAASQISQQVYNSSLQEANVRKANADASSSEKDALLKDIESKFAAQRFLMELKLNEMKGKVTEQEYNYLRDSMHDRLDAVKFQNTLTGSQSSYYNQLSGLVDVQRQIAQTNLDWLPQEKQAGLAATLQNVRTMVSQMHLNYAQAKNAFAMAALNYAQDAGFRIDNRLKESTFDLSVKLAKNSVNSEYWNQKNAKLNYIIGDQGYNDSHSPLNRFWRWSGASPAAAGGAIGYTLGKGKVKMNAPKKVKGFR